MAITLKGDTTFKFAFDGAGIDAVVTATGIQPMELKTSGQAEYVATAEGVNGEPIAMVTASDARTFTLTGYITNKTTFDGVTEFVYLGRTYIVTNRNVDYSSKEFMKGELTGEQHDGIGQVPA